MNDYPQNIINQVKYEVFNSQKTPKQPYLHEKDQRLYLSLPFVSDVLFERCKKIVQHSEIGNIMLSGKPGLSLKDHLVSTQYKAPKCHSKCLACSKTSEGNHTKCDRRMFVYELKCKICGDTYIGQSSRYPHNRIYEHCYAIKNLNDDKAIATHFIEEHDDIKNNDLFDFEFRILKYCKDYLDMLLIEAELIKKYNPNINKYAGKWKLLN